MANATVDLDEIRVTEIQQPTRTQTTTGSANNEKDAKKKKFNLDSILKMFKSPSSASTPNIDQLRKIYSNLAGASNKDMDQSFLDRVDAQDLCKWTNQMVKYLPSSKDSPDSNTTSVISHFDTIKKFYTVFQKSELTDQPEIQTFFNALQIYESVMSIAFVMYSENPTWVKAITTHVQGAIDQVESFSKKNPLLLCCVATGMLSQFGTILEAIDQKIGEIGVVRIAQFVSDIVEVLCRLLNIDLTQDMDKLVGIAQSVEGVIKAVSSALRHLFGSSMPDAERKSKWEVLEVTKKINSKLSQFENKQPIVSRTVNSFESLFKSIKALDDDLEKMTEKNQRAVAGSQQAQALTIHASQVEEVRKMGRFFQHLETIMSYGVLLFSNDAQLLTPILDHMDECTRILTKFNGLHIVYKLICGKNYLSKVKVQIKAIIKLLDDSDLKFNSPKEFIAEIKSTYPNLLYMLLKSVVDGHHSSSGGGLFGLISLPSGMQKAVEEALEKF